LGHPARAGLPAGASTGPAVGERLPDFELPDAFGHPVRFYPTGELASESRPLDTDSTTLNIEVRYQACNDQECLLPRTERFTLELPLDVIDVPRLGVHTGHGQREGSYDSMPAMRRLMWRKVKTNPLSLPKFLWKNIRMELAARRRRKNQG